ncbi:hypothetical protein NDA00_25915 [Funiculus sociatus GB2-M2]|uniref:hypothetical protein n=1 Tax=Funiculus sociatus TaxID=450527 RepID=UPI0032974791
MKIRDLKLLTNDRNYLFFALQIDFLGKRSPKIEVNRFCDRWGLSIGNFYKALGDLKNKGIVVEIASQLDLQLEPS